MKNILILSNSDMGLYKFRRELISRLCEDYKVFINVPKGEYCKALEELGATIINCNFERRSMNPIDEISVLRNYRKCIKRLKPKVVLTYTIKPNVYGGIVCKMLRTPFIANVTGLGTTIENGGLLSKVTLFLYKMGLDKASCVFFQNETNQRVFIEKGIVKGKTQVIPGSGVNLREHNFEAYPTDDGRIRFLFIGRIMKDKGIDELLYAIECVHDEGNDIRLDIVGGFDEDYGEIISAATKKGYIYYHGLQPNVHPFMKAAHCVVLPSYHEGMSNVMLEAASTGRPVITSRVPGCMETFDEGVTGLGCEPGDRDSLKEVLKKFLSLDNDQKVRMGLNGRKKMEKEFDRDMVIQSYLMQIAML